MRKTFFLLFEWVADAQDRPGSHRALMLQSRLTGKAQRAFSALSVEEARDYKFVKASCERMSWFQRHIVSALEICKNVQTKQALSLQGSCACNFSGGVLLVVLKHMTMSWI